MAVKLILVTLLVFTLSLSLAQQSGKTGGSDRRLSLRRLSTRRKVESTRNTGRAKASADILEKRKQLFQRNPSRRRNLSAESRSKTTERVRTTTEVYLEVEPPVENISNNDKEIRDLVLEKEKQDDEVEAPFKGVSEVRTVSSPSGFRSSNEQIVRISFKKTTSKPVEKSQNDKVQTNLIRQSETQTTKKPRRNPSVKVTGRRRLGIRRKGQKSGSTSQSLNNLLKIANDNSAESESLEPVDIEAVIKEMKEDNMIENTSDIEAAIHEMKEDNGIIKSENRIRGNSPRRLAGRGRNGQRKTNQRISPRKESNPNFRSFPARQNVNSGRASIPKASRTRPTPRQRLEPRPTVSPTQLDFVPTESFQGFDFTTPVRQSNPVNIVSEAPRSNFQFDQNIGGNNQNVIADQQFIAPVKPVQSSPQGNLSPQPFVATQPQATPLAPQVPSLPQQLQPRQQQVLPQRSLNLLNTQNFQAFDAQFGGSVPTNPGASQLASSIFAQPQTALLQGRDVLVNPQNNFQATPVQQGQLFQQAGRTVQQAAPQQVFQQAAPQQVFQQGAPQQAFQQAAPQQVSQPQLSSQNIPAVSFSGHPASDINLQTGSFNLRTG